jgi:hypothetical protein
MDNIYYIIITVIFALFVVFVVWWLYKYLYSLRFLPTNHQDLSEVDKQTLYTFCKQRKQKHGESETRHEPEQEKQKGKKKKK